MAIASRYVLKFRRGMAALLLGAATPVQAQNWDWTYQFASTAHVDAHPVLVSTPDASGFWAIGADALLHYTANGDLDHASGSGGGAGLVGGRIQKLAGGDPILLSYTGSSGSSLPLCTITRYAGDGTPLWQQGFGGGTCDLGVDGRDTIWVLARGVAPIPGFSPIGSYSADGVQGNVFVDTGIVDFSVNPQTDGGVYVATAGTPATILALDQNGSVRWSWNDPTHAYSLAAITLGADGNIYAAARDGANPAGSLSIVSLTATGVFRFARDASDVQISHIVAKAMDSNGNIYYVDNIADSQDQPTQLAVQRVGADGNVQWNHALAGATHCLTDQTAATDRCGLSLTPDGDILIVAQGSSQQLFRYDSGGNLLFAHALDQTIYGSVVGLSNGDALLTQDSSGFVEIDRSGNVRDAPTTAQVLGGNTGGDASTFSDDGSAYVAMGAPETPELAKISPGGLLVWKNALDVEIGSLSVAGARVCGEENRFVRTSFNDVLIACFNADTGSPVWSTVLDSNYFGYGRWPLQVLADGSVTVLHYRQDGGGWEHLRYDASGALAHRYYLPGGMYNSTTMSGLSVLLSDDLKHLCAYDAGGKQVFNVVAPAQLSDSSGASAPIVEALADGSALVVFDVFDTEKMANQTYAWLVKPNGATLWLKQIGDGEPDYAYTAGNPLAANGNFYFVFGKYNVSSRSVQARNAMGDLLWENTDIPGTTLLQDPVTGRVFVVGDLYNKLEILALAPDNGALQKAINASCPSDFGTGNLLTGCLWNRFSVAADGSLRADAVVGRVAAPSTRQLFALNNAASTPPQIRLDQPGLDGVWFAPYESGQGFTLDYIDSARTLFVPWFTYDQGGAIDPAGLNWYAIYGTVDPGATSSDLHIETAAPGAFVSGSVETHDVGTAHLSFSDCNTGTLFYQFDADTNGGAGGIITLTRLSPSSAPCALADGSAAPAQFPNAPAQGFDARQSGSWFDPAMSGQGMEITIVPGAGSYPGLAFAAWFTFDPAGQSNDPGNQQWFTLEGDLATANNGSTSLRILQTLGGTFDGQATGNTLQVGHATLTMQGCTNARMDYQFDTSTIAHGFAGLAGTLNLVKIGGCTAP